MGYTITPYTNHDGEVVVGGIGCVVEHGDVLDVSVSVAEEIQQIDLGFSAPIGRT